MYPQKLVAILFLFSITFLTSCEKTPGPEPAPPTTTSEYIFQNDYVSAYEAANNTGRKIFVDFYATWCGNCTDFKQNTLADPTVIEYIEENYIAVSLDIEEEGKQQYQDVGVSSTPLLVIYNTDGTLNTYHGGKMNSEDFLEWLDDNK